VSNSTWSFNYATWGSYGPPYQGGWIYTGSTTAGVPGETVRGNNGSNIVWAYSTLSAAFTWNLTGTMNQAQAKADVRT